MDEHGRNGTQLQVAGVEIRAPLQDRFFLRMLPPQFVATNPLAMLLDAAYGFDYPDRAVAHRPVDLRCMPQLQLLCGGRSFVRQDPPCFRQQLRLVVLEIITQSKPRASSAAINGACKYSASATNRSRNRRPNASSSSLSKAKLQATSLSPFFWKRIPRGMGKAELTSVTTEMR